MRDHVISLAIYPLFARMVKVNLLQLVPLLTHSQEAARSVIHLHAVPVVDDLQRSWLVVEREGRPMMRFLRMSDIDRRLAVAQLAGGIRFLQIAPGSGSFVALVSPVVPLWMRRLADRQTTAQQQREQPSRSLHKSAPSHRWAASRRSSPILCNVAKTHSPEHCH